MGTSWYLSITAICCILLMSSPSYCGALSLEVSSAGRRRILTSWTASFVPTAIFFNPSGSLAATDDTINLHLERGERAGMELYDTVMAGKHVVAIKSVSVNANVKNLKPGMVVANFDDSKSVVNRLRDGPFPVDLQLIDPNAVPDRFPSSDSLNTKEEPPTPTEGKESFVIRTVRDVTTGVKSRRGDLVEFVYEARMQSPVGSVYDSSAQRGTGQPYQYVIGSGDLIPGVDLGLYDMRPGEIRLLESTYLCRQAIQMEGRKSDDGVGSPTSHPPPWILTSLFSSPTLVPSPLAYGGRGNKLFGIPPNTKLFWTIQMIRVNFMGEGQDMLE